MRAFLKGNQKVLWGLPLQTKVKSGGNANLLQDLLLQSTVDSLPLPILEKANVTLLDELQRNFELLPCTTPSLVAVAERIRYQVYCVENCFEDPRNYPDELERDEFDAHSVHNILVHRTSGTAIGTVRLILPLPQALDASFPLQRVCDHPVLRDSCVLPLNSTAEISRLIISRNSHTCISLTDFPLRRVSGPLMRLGLMQAVLRSSIQNGITHWCAMMEPKLLRMLSAMGVHFVPLGPAIAHHGMRVPCYAKIAEILLTGKRERPAFWDVVTFGSGLPRMQNDVRAADGWTFRSPNSEILHGASDPVSHELLVGLT